MKIKLTNGEVLRAHGALKNLADAKLSAVGAFQVAETLDAVQRIAQNIHRAEATIADQHLQRGDDGEPVAVPGSPGRFLLNEEGSKEQTELYAHEVEIDAYRIGPRTIGGATVAPKDLAALGPLREPLPKEDPDA